MSSSSSSIGSKYEGVTSPLCTLSLALAALASACVTTTHSGLPGLEHALVARDEPMRAWRVEVAGELVGAVVSYGLAGGTLPRLHVVQNAWGQDEGYIDSLGRAWRWQPHVEGAQSLGTSALSAGVARILGISGGFVMSEVSLPELAAALASGLQESSPSLGN